MKKIILFFIIVTLTSCNQFPSFTHFDGNPFEEDFEGNIITVYNIDKSYNGLICEIRVFFSIRQDVLKYLQASDEKDIILIMRFDGQRVRTQIGNKGVNDVVEIDLGVSNFKKYSSSTIFNVESDISLGNSTTMEVSLLGYGAERLYQEIEIYCE